jgi:general stress protein YciG
MPRIYVKVQVDFDDDPDVAKLARFTRPSEARAARDLLVSMWRYCKRELTDGHVPAEVVGKLAYPDAPKIGLRDAERLVECGVAERTKTGYYLPGFLKHNNSREQVASERERKAAAGKKGGEASGQLRKAEAEAKQSASEVRSQSTEFRVQSSENTSSKEGGERPVTLHAVPATEPPHDEERCTRHPNGNPADEACRGCERVEVRKAVRASGDAERRRIAAETAARDCTRCDGVRVTDDNGRPTRTRCDHRRTA